MSGFFWELRRRKVYRVAAAYVVAAGGIIQLASSAFPAWEVPNWALRLVIMLLLLGFPIALIFAWAFDVTPEGLERTSATPDPETGALPTRRRRNIILLLVCGLAISVAAGFFVLPRATAHRVDKSIAVLPFENFSDDKENAYFADGVQDDILTNLAKIGDLKVISRTSVMGYRGRSQNVREIAKSLGVSYILEGSVRRDRNRIRVNVQLIDAPNDRHVWADEYQEDLTDVFKIQTSLARRIADTLQAQLSPTDKARLEQPPTANSEAYLAYIQAHNLQSAFDDLEKLKQAEQLYDRALELDPKFALAMARKSQLESWVVHSYDPTQARRETARALAEQALQLQPDLPEGHLALGFYYYYGERNYEAAIREFQVAEQGLPNDSEVHLALGAILRRQGNWKDSNAHLEKSAALNPKDTFALQNVALNYEMMRDFDTAEKRVDQALALSPTSFSLWEIKARIAIETRGDFSVAEQAVAKLESLPNDPASQAKVEMTRANLLLYQRQFKAAAIAAGKISDQVMASYPGALCGKYTLIGGTLKAANDDPAVSRAAFLQAKQFAENLVRENPNEAAAHSSLAQALAWLGEKEAAIAEAERSMQLLPESKDHFEGPDITTNAAVVYATVGEADKAIDLLEGLLQRPSAVTVQILKLNPIWDLVRQNPRFQALLEKHGGKS